MILPLLLAGCLPAAATEVEDVAWSSSFFQDNRDSGGAPLDASFTFHLGAFNPPAPGSGEDPWEPSPANTAEWATHWITADTVVYNPITSGFAAACQAEPLVEGVSLTGKQGYIWGSNRACPNGEWILITNPAWIWPAPGSSGLGFPETWTAGTAMAIVGQIDQGGIHLQTQLVANAKPPLLGPELWLQTYFTPEEIDTREATVSGWLADPNGNGRPNILEYAFGTHPRLAHLDRQPVHGSVALAGNSYQTLTATIDPNIEIAITAEVSTNLQTWSDGPADVVLHSQSGTQLVFRDLAKISAAQPFRAMRLRATLP